jgi:hypothetical protein
VRACENIELEINSSFIKDTLVCAVERKSDARRSTDDARARALGAI